jgi:hypothetical protein
MNSKKFLQLGHLIASWTYDENVMASWPEIIEHPGGVNQRFWMTHLGDTGCFGADLALFWYDEFNDEFGYVSEEDLYQRAVSSGVDMDKFDELDIFGKLGMIGGNTFPNLELLSVHLKYGV